MSIHWRHRSKNAPVNLARLRVTKVRTSESLEISLNHQWPELDCLAVAAEIAEIMQIGSYTSKIKRYKENISPPWGKSVVKSKQQRMDMTGNPCRWWSQSIANIMEKACKATTNTSLPRDRLLHLASQFYNKHTYIHTYIHTSPLFKTR
jgi:hypothetical protein